MVSSLHFESHRNIPKQPDYPRFAILMAAWNGSAWIEEQVKSILDQVEVRVTLFISIDESSDNTVLLVNGLAKLHPCIRILPLKSLPGGAAKNFFRLVRDVEADRFDYFALADQDDIWLPNKLSRASQILDKTENLLYSSNVIAFWQDGSQKRIVKSQPLKKWDHLFEAAGPGCTYVMTHRYFLELRGFVTDGWEAVKLVSLHDWFIYAHARSIGWHWHIDEEANVLYRQHQENVVGANVSWRSGLARFAKVQSGWYREEIIKIATLLKQDKKFPITAVMTSNKFLKIKLILSVFSIRRSCRDCFIMIIFIFLGYI